MRLGIGQHPPSPLPFEGRQAPRAKRPGQANFFIQTKRVSLKPPLARDFKSLTYVVVGTPRDHGPECSGRSGTARLPQATCRPPPARSLIRSKIRNAASTSTHLVTDARGAKCVCARPSPTNETENRRRRATSGETLRSIGPPKIDSTWDTTTSCPVFTRRFRSRIAINRSLRRPRCRMSAARPVAQSNKFRSTSRTVFSTRANLWPAL